MEIVSCINEFGNLFQLGRSFFSYMHSRWNGKEEQQIQEDDVLQLQSDLYSLQDNLPAMYNIIDRAEWKSHKHCVAQLLPKLKDALYDAEDLLDEFRWHKLKLTIEGSSAQESPYIDFFCSVITGRFNKAVDIQNRLNSLSSQLEKMGLLQITPWFDKSVRPETSSLLMEPKIFGREKVLKMMIKLLGVPTNTCKRKRSKGGPSASNQGCISLDSTEARVGSIRVLPIVGIGGVGKTTLAQNICNHSKVESDFELIIWICVSDGFDVKRLTREAIEQSTGTAPAKDNLNCLQQDLANSVNNKRILIVLDDMWDDALKENGQCWKRFCAPFKNLIRGSMMLVTTRFQKVSDLVRTMDPFPLEGLKDQVLWDFFKFCIFGSDSSNIDPVLESIGRRILPKLKGSSLAAKTLGRQLGVSLDPTKWDRILESELWELRQEETDILPALRLSYIYLPFHLKRCFSICSVYPKDYKFKKASLAEIWVAEGFVEPQGKTPLEQIAYKYFEELAHLSFFQGHYGDDYVIHDLMHDMAQLVSKDECFSITGMSDFNNVPENVRHLSILDISANCSDLLSLCKHRKLRTLLCNVSSMNEIGDSVLEQWCTKLLCMRVIFCATKSEGVLPESISNMKRLRYLKISGHSLLKSLPSALFSLYNLQVLHARISNFDNIRSCLCKLINLHGCRLLSCQNHQNCEVLVLESKFDEGQKKLSFMHYHYDSLPSGFPLNFSNIKSLRFDSCDKVKTISFSLNSRWIHSYGSIGSTFSSLTDVEIKRCINITSLEQFLQPADTPVMKKIVIEHCNSLESVPVERFEDMCFLEELKVCCCPKIKQRRLSVPSLKKLMLSDSGNLGEYIECKSLTNLHLSRFYMASIDLQKWNLPVLQELEISYCCYLISIQDAELLSTDVSHGGARRSIGKFPLLTHLTLKACLKLETLDKQLLYLPARSFHFLKQLQIWCCPHLNWQSGMVLPSSLQKLILFQCGDFSAWFPGCLENLASLCALHVGCSEGIVSIPSYLWRNLASLQELQIHSCPDLVSIGGRNVIRHIEKVDIRGCTNLKEVWQPK